MSHDLSNLGPRVIIQFENGLYITETVFLAIGVAIILAVLAILSVRKLKDIPKGAQGFAELLVEWIYNMTLNTMGKGAKNFAPYIGTLFPFLLLGNMLGLFGMRPTTADVNMTFALAFITFFLIQVTSIKNRTFIGHLKHYAEPYPFMIPIKIIEDLSFPISLSFRLFGNILGGAIIMSLVLSGLGWLSQEVITFHLPWLEAVIPLPVNAFFDIFEPILQAYIFTILSMAFISMGMVQHAIDDEDY